ncbi:MAG: glycerophosphodiester phosphodiesterase [Rubrobacteraceae bacterium]
MEIVGHGGAGDFYPGNSLQSLRKAMEFGVDRIEIDIQMAADGTLVLCHDDELAIEGTRRPVQKLPLDTIREALDEMLTLDEAIELTRSSAPLMIDMKARGYERAIAGAIRRHEIASETIVSSTWALSLRKVRALAPGVRIGLSTGHISTVVRRNALVSISSTLLSIVTPPPAILVARAIGADALMLNYRICSGAFVRAAHTAGLLVYPWTVNHPRFIRAQIERQVDGIISNRPDLVAEQLEAIKWPEHVR